VDEIEARIAASDRRIAELKGQIADRIAAEEQASPQISPTRQVTSQEIADWRRRIVRALSRLDQTGGQSAQEGVAAKMTRLSRQGVIPRSVIATMRAITELRNAVEYESKPLSDVESNAVWASWLAVQHWAGEQRLQVRAARIAVPNQCAGVRPAQIHSAPTRRYYFSMKAWPMACASFSRKAIAGAEIRSRKDCEAFPKPSSA
jgi:hypothetical protein